MGSIRLITDGIEAGYDEGGFFAFGQSMTHEFREDDWEFGTPPIKDVPVHWSIRLDDVDPFERYVSYTYPPSELSPRVPLLRNFFAQIEKKPVGEMRRWDENEPINLLYHLPKDPVIATLIMGVIAGDRELIIWGQGWHFLRDDEKLAPAATTVGFMERKEPAYTVDVPVLRIR